MSATIIGIDPGIVDTGVVRFTFYQGLQRLTVSSAVLPTFDLATSPATIDRWIRGELLNVGHPKAHIFIEKYVPRPGMAPNVRMTDMQRALVTALPAAKLVSNTGIKQVITQEMMELLHVWRFGIATHHQDLRSAARIGLYGAAKDEDLNVYMADVIRDRNDWHFDVLKGVRL